MSLVTRDPCQEFLARTGGSRVHARDATPASFILRVRRLARLLTNAAPEVEAT